MKPGIYNFDIYQGADLSFPITVTGMDLTSFAARAGMRSIWDPNIYKSFTVELLDSVDATWVIVLSMPNAETSSIKRPSCAGCAEKCTYFWDLELVSADSKVYRMAQGQITVWPEACR